MLLFIMSYGYLRKYWRENWECMKEKDMDFTSEWANCKNTEMKPETAAACPNWSVKSTVWKMEEVGRDAKIQLAEKQKGASKRIHE